MATDWSKFTPVNDAAAGDKPATTTDWSQFKPVEKRGALGEIGNQLKAGVLSDLPEMAGNAIKYASDPGKAVYKIGQGIADFGTEQGKRADLQASPEDHNIVTNTLAAGARMIPQSLAPAAAIGAGLALAPEAAIGGAAGLAISAIGGAVPMGMSQAQTTLEKAREKGINEADALSAARQTGLIEGAGEAIGTYAGGKLLGIGAKIAQGIGGKAAEGTLAHLTNPGVVKPFLKELPKTMATEVGTEMGQNAGEAAVEQKYGIDNQTPYDAAMGAIAPTIGMTLLLAPFGLAGFANNARASRAKTEALSSQATEPSARKQIADHFTAELTKVDPDAAAQFAANTGHAIANGQPITVDASLFGKAQPAPTAPEAIDPATTGQAHYSTLVEQSAPMALDKAQNIAAVMNQDGAESFTVAPHGDSGFTVVPTSWMTDEQLTSFASVQGDGGRLPAPAEANPAIRVDASGNAIAETPEQTAEVEAMKQRYIDMGKPTPRGVNPNEAIPAVDPNAGAISKALSLHPESVTAAAPSTDTGTIQKAAEKAPAIAAAIPAPAEISAPVAAPVQQSVTESAPAAPAPLTANKSEDIAGAKLDKKWTEFDQASGTLGIDRAQMPQIKAENRGALVNFLNARGITSEHSLALPTDLKATQREFSPQKVEQAKGFTGNDRSILVSSDGHVLDGHHQWLAKRESGQPVKVIRLNAPIRELLTAVSEFPSAQTAAGAETAQNGATNGTADAIPAALAQASSEIRGDNGVQGVPDALVLPAGRGVGDAAAGTGTGSQPDIPAGPADRNGAVIQHPVIARVGTTPNSAEPVTVRNGVVHIGEYPAQDADKATDITVPEGATFEQVADALRQGKALSTKQRIYVGAKGMRQADKASQTAPDAQTRYADSVSKWNALSAEYKTADEARRAELRPQMDELNLEQVRIKGEVQRNAMSTAKQKREAENAITYGAHPIGTKIQMIGYGTDSYWQKVGEDKWQQAFSGNLREVFKTDSQMDGNTVVSQPDRRADSARRQAVAEMDVETLRRELLTDTLTGIGNRRAYDESEKLPAQVSVDADSLKWINDNLGHASGDKLLKAIGQALGGETRNAYHVSGDEFIVQAATEAEAQAIMDRAVARMADARIDATNADGQDIVLTGVGVSYGIAGDLHEAEKRLGQHKAERETQGQRAARGETPPNAAIGSARGEDQPGDAAAETGQVAPAAKPSKLDAAATSIDDELNAALKELADALKKQSSQLNTGIDPAILALGVKVGSLYVAKGVVKFAQYSKAIIDALRGHGVSADQIKPHLKQFYAATKQSVDDATFDQMDDDRAVRGFDLDSLDAKQEAAPAAPAEPEATQAIDKIVGDKLETSLPEVEHVTKGGAGRTLQGVISKTLTEDQARALDTGTFKKDGGWFIRMKHVARPEAKAPDATPEVAPTKMKVLVNSDSRSAYEGEADFNAGKPRVLPSYYTSQTSQNAKDWYRGWDKANVAAPTVADVAASHFDAATKAEPAPEKAGTVSIPGAIGDALQYTMQRQKDKIRRTGNKLNEPMSLAEKTAIQAEVSQLEAGLRKMRTSIFDAEDAIAEAIKRGDVEPFKAFAELFPRAASVLGEHIKDAGETKQPTTLDELIGAVDAGYKAHFDYAGVDGRTVWIEKTDNGWVMKSRDDGSDATITKGGAGAKGGWAKYEALDNIESDGKHRFTEWKPLVDTTAAPATNKAQEGENDATRKLDQAGAGALEGTPAADGGADGRGGNASGKPDGSRAGDGQGNTGSGAAGLQPDGSLGNDTGASPVPGAGARAGRGNGTKRGPRRNGGLQQDNGLGEDAGRAGAVNPEDAAPNAPKTDAPQFKPDDFIIDDDLGLGEGGQKTKFKNNVAAIRLLAKLDEENRPATADEQRVLAKYVGWGGIAQAFDEANQDWSKEYAELRGLMDDKEHAAAARSTRYAHYTSREIIVDGIYSALRHMGFSGGRVLEGGAGVGNFIGLMPTDMRSAGRVTAVEREPFAAKIAKHLYPKQNVQQADFTEFVGNDDYYDAAVGNPPFASDPQVDSSGRKHLTGLSLHNYFFAKEVDMLREGGILAQVITNGFLDAKGDTARQYISGRAKLLGAIRLPNNAFSKNANTEVTTDLIFLQKLPEADWNTKATREDAKRWMDVGTFTDANGKDVALNRYFIANPQMMLGEYGAHGSMYGPDFPALIARAGQDTLALLREAVTSLPANVYTDRSVTNTANAVNAAAVALDKPTVQEGGFYIDGDKLFQRLPDVAGEARGTPITAATKWTEKTTLGESGFDRIKQLTAMRDTLRSLLSAEIRGDDAMDGLRATLNQQYDAYAKKHGLLNDSGTARVFGDDPDFPLLASLEHGYTPGMGAAAAKTHGIKAFKSSAKKGPIFNQRVVDARKTVDKADSPADALSISMAERGKLDTDYIGQLLGMPASEVLENLSTGDKPLLFLDPSSDEYVLRDAYLSGNVRAKLKQAQMAGMMNNVRALEDVIPEDVGAHEITARVGSPWTPEKVYEEFAVELFGEGTNARVGYVLANSSYALSVTGGSDIKLTNTWGTKDYPGDKLLSAILNNRIIKVTAKDGEGKIYTLVKETEDANTKAQEIRDRFQDWLFADPERSEVLVRAYNDTNNNYVTREYDGAWMRFPGKVPDSIIKFRRHQRNAIARILQDRTALLDHVVGAGKTFTIIAAAMELKRTGLAKKPLIVVPNHLVKQWAADFYRLYPGAKILTATKKDFAKLNRRRFLAKIATGDWDAVIMAHSSFGFVRPAPEFEARFNEEQIKNVVDTIKAVEDGEGDDKQKKRTVKQLQGLIERLENRIKALRDKPMDALLDFEQIGVDQLFVDEAHLFKNLMFSTKMQQVQGLGDSAGSQRAYDMYIKANQIFEKNGRGQGVVFATGTPVSNSLAEMYHMMRYLMPDQMKEMGFESFDAWANTYASVNQVFMQKMGGDGYKASNRMSTFVNTIELLKVFDQVSDTVTMDDIKAAFKEENDGREFPLPKLKGDKRQPVALTKSQAQNDYMDDIAQRAKALETRKGPPQKGEDNALVIMTDARKAAMDIRLVRPDITEREIGGRIDRAADAIIERYQQYDANKGTQLVFSDMGTPLKHAKAELKEYEELRTVIDAGLTEQVQALAAIGNEDALSKIEDSEAAQEKLDAKGNDWLGAVKAALRGFSVYDDLKAALVERGIPEAEIAFIHDANTDDQKAALFRKVNSGQIRVVVGSTAKMGAGTNVQERLVALHHLDVPWKPSDIEQREGRIIRQGNTLADTIDGFEVEILAYVTQDTLDLRMWQIQEVKLKMINQLRTRKVGREIDNAFEDMEMSAGEMQAAATGNMDLLKEIQLRAEMKKLEQRKRSFDAQKSDLVNRARKVNEQLVSLPKQIEKSGRMDAAAKAYRAALEKQRAGFKVVIDGTTYTDQTKAGEYLEGKINARAKDDKGNDRAAPLAVVMDGVEYTARPMMAEAYANIRGDVSPFMLEFDGTMHNRRPVAAKAIAQAVAEAVADEKLEFVGKMGAFEISVEGQKSRYGKMLDVVVGVDGASLNMVIEVADENADAQKIATQVIKVADSLVTTAGNMLDYNTSQLERAKKAKAELDNTAMPGDWADASKLEKARAEHKELLNKLKGADEKPADGAEKADDTAFSRNGGLTDAEAIKRVIRVQSIVSGIKANWKNAPEIIVVADMQDAKIPQRVRDMDAEMKSNGATGEPRGFISAGKVYIVAGQHKSVEDVVTTVAHETIGHAGLRGLYGESLTPILRQIVNMRRAEVDAKVKEYGFDPKSDRDLLRAAEEVLANLAQTQPEMGFVKRAIAAIRNWLRDNGLNLKLTDADVIAKFILPARAFIENGRGPDGGSRSTAFSRADYNQPMMTERQFYNSYAQSVDIRGRDGSAAANKAAIMRDGFKQGMNVNALPASRGGKPFNVIERNYQPKAGDTVYLIPKSGWKSGPNGIKVNAGWKPEPHEVVTITDPERPMYEYYKDALEQSGDTAFSRTVEIRAAVSERAADLLTSKNTFNGWWHKSLGTQYHKAHVDKEHFAPVFNAVQLYLSGMSSFANGAADLADRLIPQLNSIRDLWNTKQPSQADIKAISGPIFAGTLADEAVYGADDLRDRFKLTPGQIDLYVQFRAAVDKSLDDLGKTDILRYAGADVADMRDDVLNAPTASRAALIVAKRLQELGKDDDAKVVVDKGTRVADLKAKGYAPLTRFGRYTLHVTEGADQLYFSLFESEAEANAMARQMKQDNPGATITQGVLSAESYKLFNGLSPDTLELFAGALGVEKNEIVQEYIKLAKSNRDAMKRMIKRKGIAGFSEDVPRILASFITSNARQSASNVYGGVMEKAADAIPKEKGDVKDEAIKMIEFARNPTEDAAKLRGMLFVQYIGGSVASAMVNLTQPLTMSFPYLNQFSKHAGVELAKAMKQATVGGNLDVDLKAALKRAEADGVVSPQEIHQLQAEASKKGAGVGALARMFGVKGDTANKLDDLSKRGLFAWGSLFSLAEQFNRRTTFIAAYNIARANKEANPFAFAEKAVVETQGIYNRGNRPNWARGAPGALVFTFKQYGISYMEFLKRLPPKERAIALAIMVLAAGLQGLPFADDLDDLIDTLAQKMGYAWNTKAEKEKFAASILGQSGSDFVMNGTSALPGFPLDFSARLGMSNLLPGTGIMLKNKTDKMGEVLDVFGVVGGVVKDALRGEVLPIAVRNMLKAADMANTDMYRDSTGKKVIDTDGVDALMKGIGFQPASVAQESRAARMDMQDVMLVKNTEAEIAGDMAQGVFSGDKEAVAKAREKLVDWNTKNPDKPIVITSKQILQRVKQMQMSRRERLIKSAPKELRGGLVE